MKLEDAFERVAVINLQFKSDRRSRLETHMTQCDIADPKKIHWVRAICGDWTPPPAWWGAGNGAWGCLMSHIRVAQDAVHDKIDSYCVLEDDVVFHPRATEMLNGVMRELPKDWGQLYLGGQFLHREPEFISPWIVRPYNVNRTHAFALSRGAIPKFLQHVMHAPDYFAVRTSSDGDIAFDHNCFHIDHQLGRAHERRTWNTYAPSWWLAGQDIGSSNISGRINPRLWWHWRAKGNALPFFVLKFPIPHTQRSLALRYIHPGNNLVRNTLVDIGINKELNDEELRQWLFMIAGEAIERWKLPGFELPNQESDLFERTQRLWPSGVLEFSEPVVNAAKDYPFNGYCGAHGFELSHPLETFSNQ